MPPRASGSGKRYQGANNRDTRHESGVVAPGRRISRPKSQGQLHANPRSTGAAAAAATASTAQSSAQTTGSGTSNRFSNGSAKHAGDVKTDRRTADLAQRREFLATSSSEPPSTDSQARPFARSPPEMAHRLIDVNDAKNSNVNRDTGPLEFAFTVLRSYPMQDTIAILVVLMQISPVTLASLHILFTLLTFVPPVTTSSGLSITEIFDGNQGTPSLTTLICMDVIMLGIWLFLWAPMQQFILDLAQVVIALTLGGGGASRSGTANNILLCVAVVAISHWARYTRWSSLMRLSRLLVPSYLFRPAQYEGVGTSMGTRSFDKKGSYGWVRSILAIHILTQGLVRYIREWYLRREKRDSLSQSQMNPEAGKSGPGQSPGGNHANEGALATRADAASSASFSGPVASSKKRRKQSARVRIRQPLWAALASTKIVVVKEYELSQTAFESVGSDATDIHNLGSARFNLQPEQIWICYVGWDEVCVNTSHFPDPANAHGGRYEEEGGNEMDGNYSSCTPRGVKHGKLSGIMKRGIDRSKPFYVRVNKAVWQPTRLVAIEEGEEEQDKAQGRRWTGDIYGLTPLSNYECEFVSTETDRVIFSASVRTIQAPARAKDLELATASKAGGGGGSAGHGPGAGAGLSAGAGLGAGQNSSTGMGITGPRPSHRRHESPATTLRASIAAAEANLCDEKSRLRSARKDNNRRVNAARKDLEKLSSAVQSASGNDEKLRQKIAQNRIQEKQVEQMAEELDAELSEEAAMSEDHVVHQHRARQADWTAEKTRFDLARAEFKAFKVSIDTAIKTLEEEQSSLHGKRNKIATRIARADNEHARITDANVRGLNEAERRRQERANLEAGFLQSERALQNRIFGIREQNARKQGKINEMAAHMQDYLLAFQKKVAHDSITPGSGLFPVPMGFGNPGLPGPPTTSFYGAGTVAGAAVAGRSTIGMAAASWSSPSPAITTTTITTASYPKKASLWPQISAPLQTPSIMAPPAFSPFAPGFQKPPGASAYHKSTRARSSSMLSNLSGFTQSSDDDDGKAHRTHTSGASLPQAIGQGRPVTTSHKPAQGAPRGLRPLPDLAVAPSIRQPSDPGLLASNSASASAGGSGPDSGRSSIRSGNACGGSNGNPLSSI